MKAVQRPDNTFPRDLEPGEWAWYQAGLAFRAPSGHEESCGVLNRAGGPTWTITGDGDTITVNPSIHVKPGAGAEQGEWHGWLVNGEWSGG